MIPVWSSALKDNEIDVSDLPMPRILGEGEEEPVEVWVDCSEPGTVYMPRPTGDIPLGRIDYVFKNEPALHEAARRCGVVPSGYPWPLERVIAEDKAIGDVDWVVLIDESYTVIETWRV